MVEVSAANVVAVLTRAPSAGGKTRLFAALGRPVDPILLRALLLDTLDGVAAPDVVRVVAVEPASACDEVAALVPDDVRVMAQSHGSLGDRMQELMERLLAEGARAVALVGSDLPEIRPATISGAFAVFADAPDQLVLGPSIDGGYYLIAATRTYPVFEGVSWGTPGVLEETRALARRRGIPIHLLDQLPDIDTIDDLRRLADGARADARRTRRWAVANL